MRAKTRPAKGGGIAETASSTSCQIGSEDLMMECKRNVFLNRREKTKLPSRSIELRSESEESLCSQTIPSDVRS